MVRNVNKHDHPQKVTPLKFILPTYHRGGKCNVNKYRLHEKSFYLDITKDVLNRILVQSLNTANFKRTKK